MSGPFLNLLGPPRNLRSRYNIAPTTTIDIVGLGVGGHDLVPMRWETSAPGWRQPLKELPATFNARAKKPMFRSAFKVRRCIIPASDFYECESRREGPSRLLVA